MDAAGAVSSVATVLQITATIIRISFEYIRGVPGSTKAIKRPRKELRGFRSILEQVDEQS